MVISKEDITVLKNFNAAIINSIAIDDWYLLYFIYICFRFTVRYGTISKFNTKYIF